MTGLADFHTREDVKAFVAMICEELDEAYYREGAYAADYIHDRAEDFIHSQLEEWHVEWTGEGEDMAAQNRKQGMFRSWKEAVLALLAASVIAGLVWVPVVMLFIRRGGTS